MILDMCFWTCFLAVDSSCACVYTIKSSAKRANLVVGVWGKSEMYRLNNVGKRTDPWGTPA